MGADGGSIPKRNEMVKRARGADSAQKDDLQLGREAIMMDRWNLCALTREPLSDPVVACRLGRMYNKDAVLEHLISRNSLNGNNGDHKSDEEPVDALSHVKRMKDVKELKLCHNPSFGVNGKQEKLVNGRELSRMSFKYLCPITRKEMNGTQTFRFSWPCGCVYSEQAFKELSKSRKDKEQNDSVECILCGCEIKNPELDIITLYPKPDELDKFKQRLIDHANQDSKKKKKKRKLEDNN